MCTPYVGETAEHLKVPSCKRLSTLLAISLLVNPSFVSAMALSSRSTLLPFTVQDTEVTCGLAKVLHCRSRTASSSTVTSSDPNRFGPSEGGKKNHKLYINAFLLSLFFISRDYRDDTSFLISSPIASIL